MCACSTLALLAMMASGGTVAAADMTITDSRTYDPSTMAGFGFIIDGVDAAFTIGADDTVTTLVDLRNGGTIDNAGVIERTGASNRGVVGGVGNVVNHDGGQITASDATGVLLFSGGSVDNSGTGTLISGSLRGVSIQGGTGTIDNTGGATIETTGESAIYVDADAAVTNGIGSTITGKGSGIRAFGNLTVDNYGTIEGIDQDAISIENGAVTNSGSGALISAGDTGVFIDGTGEMSNKDGAAIEADNDGVVMNWGGDVYNIGGSTIDAGNIGVTIADIGTLTNSGMGTRITGATAGVLLINYDVDVDLAHVVVNKDGASIAGGSYGVEFTVDAGGSVSNTGGSTISGENYGIYADGDRVTVTNSGAGSLIENTSTDSSSRYTILLAGGGEVTNSGGARIVGASAEDGIGIYFFDPDYDPDVASTLTGSVINGVGSSITGSKTAIHSLIDTAVDNAGRIEGNVWLLDNAVNDVTLRSGGVITGELFIGHNALSTLTLTGSGTQLYSEAVEGSTSFASTITKSGAGSWVLDRDIVSDVVNVDEGSLYVGVEGSGSLTGTVTVDAGAMVGGSGRIYGDLLSSGTVGPGNSPGVLVVEGHYLQEAGAVLEIQLDPLNLLSDRLDVVADGNGLHGTATIKSGAVLDIAATSNAAYTLGTRYTVLSTENGLFGEAADPASFVLTGDLTPSAFLTLKDEYDANSAYIVVRQTQALDDAAAGDNQSAVAAALDELDDDSPLRNLALRASDAAAAQVIFDGLSGEIHADINGALLEDSRRIGDAANRRLRATLAPSAITDGVVVWGEAQGATTESSSSDSAAAFGRNSGGFVAGADAPVGDWRLGVLSSYSQSGYYVPDRASSGSSENYDIGVYGGVQWGGLSFRGAAIYGWRDIETHRDLMLPNLEEQLAAEYDAATSQVFGELAYRFNFGSGTVEPFVSFDYVRAHTDGFSESGGSAALTGEARTTASASSIIGARASAGFGNATTQVSVHGMLGWQHAYADVTPTASLSFGGDGAFDIAGAPIARDALAVEVALDVTLASGATLGAAYSARIAEDAATHSLQLSFDQQF